MYSHIAHRCDALSPGNMAYWLISHAASASLQQTEYLVRDVQAEPSGTTQNMSMLLSQEECCAPGIACNIQQQLTTAVLTY